MKRILLLLMVGAFALFVVGCSENPSEPEATDQINLNDEFGGFTTTDEAPGFGDPDLVASESEEEEIDDAILASPLVDSVVKNDDGSLFHFRAVWGRLSYDSTSTTPTVWDGSLTASDGALVIRRLIRFELNQDGFLQRNDPLKVEWLSTTTVHNDGVAIDFYVPPTLVVDTTYVTDTLGNVVDMILDTLPVTPVTLTFGTGPYTQTFDVSELGALDTVVNLPDGNSIVFQSIQVFRNLCQRGGVSGQWGYDEEGNGMFRGLWMSHVGMAGYVQGNFGINDDKEKVFFGKWINRNGEFEGLISGTWKSSVPDNASESARRRAAGHLEGTIFDHDGNPIGQLKGVYKSGVKWPSGWFQARWKLDCDQTVSLSNRQDDGF